MSWLYIKILNNIDHVFGPGSKMTAGFVGQTSGKVTEILDSARGCVLFIDEAYDLGKSSFGVEAMNTLLAAMTDTKNYKGMVVIIAGYKSALDEMLGRNEGLRSRFSNVIDFPDWSCEDCVTFFTRAAAKENFQFDEELKTLLSAGFEELIRRPGITFYNRTLAYVFYFNSEWLYYLLSKITKHKSTVKIRNWKPLLVSGDNYSTTFRKAWWKYC